MENNEIRKAVRQAYGKIAKKNKPSNIQRKQTSCCNPSTSDASSCSNPSINDASKRMGYTKIDLEQIPENSNLGLGCGNPVALASIKEGEIVVDLGSGAGFDAFLASKRVGENGQVIGVDMTPDMIDLARLNAKEHSYTNVEFRLGEIENLPIVNNTVDLVMSNCVINLSPEKQRVFNEAFRVLKPGGRITISDMVLIEEIPEPIRNNPDVIASCIGGASLKHKYLEFIQNAGFEDIRIEKDEGSNEEEAKILAESAPIDTNFDTTELVSVYMSVRSITVTANKPEQ